MNLRLDVEKADPYRPGLLPRATAISQTYYYPAWKFTSGSV